MLDIKGVLADVVANRGLFRRVAQKLHSREAIFDRCYADHLWGSAESGSGRGSELGATEDLRNWLPDLFRRYAVASMLDAPCGDWNWMRRVDLDGVDYVGVDIVPAVIARNRGEFERPDRRFMIADLTRDPLPRADLILCRDCWVHLSFQDIAAMLANFRRSGAVWLLASDSPAVRRNRNKLTSPGWRYLNLSRAPFDFPPPVEIRKDHYSDVAFQIGLWRVADLPDLKLH